MSSWLNILTNKNPDKEFESKHVKKSDENVEDSNIEYELYTLQLKDYDEEFDRIYETLINDLNFEFKLSIEEECLPFMDIHPYLNKSLNNTFYEFIKNHSHNYNEVIDNVNKINDVIIKEYDSNNEYYNEQEFD
jgi:hypothetical protein